MSEKSLIKAFVNSVTRISFLPVCKREDHKATIFFKHISESSGYEETAFSICSDHPKFEEAYSLYKKYISGRHIDYTKPNVREQDRAEVLSIVRKLIKSL